MTDYHQWDQTFPIQRKALSYSRTTWLNGAADLPNTQFPQVVWRMGLFSLYSKQLIGVWNNSCVRNTVAQGASSPNIGDLSSASLISTTDTLTAKNPHPIPHDHCIYLLQENKTKQKSWFTDCLSFAPQEYFLWFLKQALLDVQHKVTSKVSLYVTAESALIFRLHALWVTTWQMVEALKEWMK